MADEFIRLGLKVTGKEDVDTLRMAHKALRDEVYDVADTYEVLTTDLDTARRAMKGLEDQTREVYRAEQQLETATRSAEAATRTHTTSTMAAGGAVRNLNRDFLLAGQAVQDFQAAGLMGISNNLDQLVLAIGGPAGLAATVIIAGAALLAFKEPLAKFGSSLLDAFRGADQAIPALESLKQMGARLKEVTGRLEEMREKQAFTNDELEKYNGLAKEEADLERAVREEREKRAKIEEILKSKDKETKERGSAFTEAVAGHGPEVQTALEETLQNRAQKQVRAFAANIRDKLIRDFDKLSPDEYKARAAADAKALQDYADLEAGSKTDLAQDLMRRAAGGDELALKEIQGLTTGGFGGGGGTLYNLQERYTAASPEGKAAAKARADDEKKARADEKKAMADAEEQAQAEYDAEAERFQREVEGVSPLTGTTYSQRRTERERKAKAAAAKEKAAVIQAEQERKRQEAEDQRRLSPEAVIEERIGGQIARESGLTLGQGKEVAHRAMELNRAGIDAMTAQQQAMREMMVLLRGQVGFYEQLRRQADAQAAWAREMQQRQRTFLNRGR